MSTRMPIPAISSQRVAMIAPVCYHPRPKVSSLAISTSDDLYVSYGQTVKLK